MNLPHLSIYIHVPFCSVKCSYCAFNIYTQLEYLIPRYVDALCKEIRLLGATNIGHKVHSIYFGGGTPTLLSAAQYAHILSTLYQSFDILPNAEISTEANPDNLQTLSTAQGLKSAGINRISLGVQSVHADELAMFGRLHGTTGVDVAVANVRAAGFDNLNLDLIYGNPNQTLEMWQTTLARVIAYEPEHFSLYALGIEPKTALSYWIERGKLPLPDEDLSAEMYDVASEYLATSGFAQYEISNWAKPQYESQHNIQYWRNLPYLGLGPGAHGYANGIRYVVEPTPRYYIEKLEASTATLTFPQTPAIREWHTVSREDEISETIMMGLRLLNEGIQLDVFESRFGVSFLTLRGDEIARYVDYGMLSQDERSVRLTSQGRLVSNRILRDLI